MQLLPTSKGNPVQMPSIGGKRPLPPTPQTKPVDTVTKTVSQPGPAPEDVQQTAPAPTTIGPVVRIINETDIFGGKIEEKRKARETLGHEFLDERKHGSLSEEEQLIAAQFAPGIWDQASAAYFEKKGKKSVVRRTKDLGVEEHRDALDDIAKIAEELQQAHIQTLNTKNGKKGSKDLAKKHRELDFKVAEYTNQYGDLFTLVLKPGYDDYKKEPKERAALITEALNYAQYQQFRSTFAVYCSMYEYGEGGKGKRPSFFSECYNELSRGKPPTTDKLRQEYMEKALAQAADKLRDYEITQGARQKHGIEYDLIFKEMKRQNPKKNIAELHALCEQQLYLSRKAREKKPETKKPESVKTEAEKPLSPSEQNRRNKDEFGDLYEEVQETPEMKTGSKAYVREMALRRKKAQKRVDKEKAYQLAKDLSPDFHKTSQGIDSDPTKKPDYGLLDKQRDKALKDAVKLGRARSHEAKESEKLFFRRMANDQRHARYSEEYGGFFSDSYRKMPTAAIPKPVHKSIQEEIAFEEARYKELKAARDEAHKFKLSIDPDYKAAYEAHSYKLVPGSMNRPRKQAREHAKLMDGGGLYKESFNKALDEGKGFKDAETHARNAVKFDAETEEDKQARQAYGKIYDEALVYYSAKYSKNPKKARYKARLRAKDISLRDSESEQMGMANTAFGRRYITAIRSGKTPKEARKLARKENKSIGNGLTSSGKKTWSMEDAQEAIRIAKAKSPQHVGKHAVEDAAKLQKQKRQAQVTGQIETQITEHPDFDAMYEANLVKTKGDKPAAFQMTYKAIREIILEELERQKRDRTVGQAKLVGSTDKGVQKWLQSDVLRLVVHIKKLRSGNPLDAQAAEAYALNYEKQMGVGTKLKPITDTLGKGKNLVMENVMPLVGPGSEVPLVVSGGKTAASHLSGPMTQKLVDADTKSFEGPGKFEGPGALMGPVTKVFSAIVSIKDAAMGFKELASNGVSGKVVMKSALATLQSLIGLAKTGNEISKLTSVAGTVTGFVGGALNIASGLVSLAGSCYGLITALKGSKKISKQMTHTTGRVARAFDESVVLSGSKIENAGYGISTSVMRKIQRENQEMTPQKAKTFQAWERDTEYSEMYDNAVKNHAYGVCGALISILAALANMVPGWGTAIGAIATALGATIKAVRGGGYLIRQNMRNRALRNPFSKFTFGADVYKSDAMKKERRGRIAANLYNNFAETLTPDDIAKVHADPKSDEYQSALEGAIVRYKQLNMYAAPLGIKALLGLGSEAQIVGHMASQLSAKAQ